MAAQTSTEGRNSGGTVGLPPSPTALGTIGAEEALRHSERKVSLLSCFQDLFVEVGAILGFVYTKQALCTEPAPHWRILGKRPTLTTHTPSTYLGDSRWGST